MLQQMRLVSLGLDKEFWKGSESTGPWHSWLRMEDILIFTPLRCTSAPRFARVVLLPSGHPHLGMERHLPPMPLLQRSRLMVTVCPTESGGERAQSGRRNRRKLRRRPTA